ncbi:uncharacterized protein [Chelonus insularis]|uniref:uncharacterized protein n=1 Tax=Chelonus insularis TaxID=460826 RepID=UPI001589003A|nr:uncharacterized protein LOC118069576 [Chelonus insularis]
MPLPPLFDGHSFPSYIKDASVKEIQVYWFSSKFTQSRYPPGQETSQACTLICLLVAQRICQSGLQIKNIEKYPQLGIFIAESIVEGNRRHASIIRKSLVSHPYLDTVEALKFGGKRLKSLVEWKFHIFREDIKKNISNNIQQYLEEWYQSPKADTLIMLLITCGRTILYIFQEMIGKIILFDSHNHSTPQYPDRGLVIAQAKFEQLKSLCNWYIDAVLYNCFNAHADQYELAFLYQS